MTVALNPIFGWTSEREAVVTEMWEGGYSAQQIANRLGGVTRNAVIGKVRRLKLPFRARHGAQSGHGRAKSGDFLHHHSRGRAAALERRVLGDRQRDLEWFNTRGPIPQAEIPGPDLVIPPAERRTLDKLEPGDCRWPFGDPRTADYHYCNRMAVGAPDRFHGGALPYCEFHAKRAYRPVTPARTVTEVGNPMLFHHKGSTGVSTKELAEFDELKR